MHLSIVREGLYSTFAQRNVVPAQYWRDEARIQDYLSINTFLKDINNERVGDEEVTLPDGGRTVGEDEPDPRNETYKVNFSSLTNLVMFRFR